MGIILMIFATFFAAIVCGTVLLIQSGGWLAIMAAILILCQYFISLGLIITLAAYGKNNKKNSKEETKNEGMGT